MNGRRQMKERTMAAAIRSFRHEPRESGQALVMMVGVMLLSLALLAVIIDGGNVATQQRFTQIGSDSTAEAGALVLASRLAGAPEPVGGWDGEVVAKVAASAAANSMTVQAAYYTDICGIPLRSNGAAALNPDGTENLSTALEVGKGGLPGGTATTPDCPSMTVGPVAGVLVIGHKTVDAYVAGAIGVPQFQVTTRATAVTGYLQGFCGSSQGDYCAVFPLTIPVNALQCDGNGDPVLGTTAWEWNDVITVPLCKAAPGNVGWLDWDPPAGGADEITCSTVNPDNPPVILPSWQYVAATGNTNGGGNCADDETGVNYTGVEEAMRKYDGQIVLIPQFDMTCRTGNTEPDPNSAQPAINTGPFYGCPNLPGGGNGQNVWYRMPSFAYFELCSPDDPACGGRHGAYISGGNASECNTGNGATSCLVGKFTDIVTTGTVGPGIGAGTNMKALGVQLIR
jgi:hypothetical protein